MRQPGLLAMDEDALRHKRRIPAAWNDQIYVAHDFAHAHYNTNVHPADWDLGLRERR